MAINWRRVKQRISSPDKHYERKKRRRDWLKEKARQDSSWLLVDQDECWFSRFAQSSTNAWYEADAPVYLMQSEPKRAETQQALASYGAVRQDNEAVLVSFSSGQPDRLETWQFVMGLLVIARAENKRVLVIIWDNANWHKSKELRQWIRAYNQGLPKPSTSHVCWCIVYQRKVPGSIPLNHAGFMPNGRSVIQVASSRLASYASDFVSISRQSRSSIHSR